MFRHHIRGANVPNFLLQQFCREVILWNALSHPNVLKLVGVQGDMDKRRFIMISDWMVNGNIMQFVKKNHVNRLELVEDFNSSLPSSTKYGRDSYMGRPGVSSTFTTPASYMAISKVSVTLRFETRCSF